jgi:hypothetical protein
MDAKATLDLTWKRDQRRCANSSQWPQAALLHALACAIWLAVSSMPAMALEEPVIWRDPDTGCAYFLSPQGGIAPRYLRDGSPDCPNARAGARLVDETAQGIARGLAILEREVERLRERFDAPDRRELPTDRNAR